MPTIDFETLEQETLNTHGLIPRELPSLTEEVLRRTRERLAEWLFTRQNQQEQARFLVLHGAPANDALYALETSPEAVEALLNTIPPEPALYASSEPDFVGRMPVRQELTIIPPRQDTTVLGPDPPPVEPSAVALDLAERIREDITASGIDAVLAEVSTLLNMEMRTVQLILENENVSYLARFLQTAAESGRRGSLAPRATRTPPPISTPIPPSVWEHLEDSV